LKGLGLLGNPKEIADSAFKPIVEFSFGIILQKTDESKLNEHAVLSKTDPINVKHCYSSLVSFILESAKINADPLILKGVLEQENVDSQRIEFIVNLYSNTKEAIRILLSTTNFHYPHITGIDWRLDYFIKSNSMEKVNNPVYMISLETKKSKQLGTDGNDTENVEFTCTLEQLQDLLNRLRDAAKQVERSAATL